MALLLAKATVEVVADAEETVESLNRGSSKVLYVHVLRCLANSLSSCTISRLLGAGNNPMHWNGNNLRE